MTLPHRTAAILASLALAASACTSSTGARPIPLPKVRVDPGLRPSEPTLGGDVDRPLAAVAGDRGSAIDFVDNELIVSAHDKEAVDRFLVRWPGRLLERTDPARFGLFGLESQYLVRVDASGADVSRLPEELRRTDPQATGNLRVSSDAGMRLITVATQESLNGVTVALNFVGRPTGYQDRQLKDANGASISPNPFDWTYMRAGPPQDIGVTEAWRMLDRSRRLGNRIRVAVLDGGFWSGADLAPGWRARATSVVPARPALGTISTAKTWHGTAVAETLAAIPGDGVGTAGSGGPVVDVIPIYVGDDIASALRGLYAAVQANARIISMSFVWDVPALLTGTVSLFNSTTEFLRRSGVLLFAGAGNEGRNVDARDCLLACWESTWFTPCENDGVICVGGLGPGSTFRDRGSNYGNKDVDISGPYEVYLGPDPEYPANQTRTGRGTSFSTPFVAGVAALVWSTDLARSADEVEGILMSTAHDSRDPTVTRYVNARAAVSRALGNTPPVVTITDPANGATVGYGGLNHITLRATAQDDEDAGRCCEITWTSDVDGGLGTGAALDVRFESPGTRTITAVATDSRGAASVPSRIRIRVTNGRPTIRILQPASGVSVLLGVPTLFRASVTDPNQATIPCDRVEWVSSKDRVMGGPDVVADIGCSVLLTFGATGTRDVLATATDERGATGEATIWVNVIRPSQGSRPMVSIVSPQDGSTLSPEASVQLVGRATGPDGAGSMSYRWSVVVDGAETTISSTLEAEWIPGQYVPFHCGGADATLRLSATNADGTSSAEIHVTVDYPVC